MIKDHLRKEENKLCFCWNSSVYHLWILQKVMGLRLSLEVHQLLFQTFSILFHQFLLKIPGFKNIAHQSIRSFWMFSFKKTAQTFFFLLKVSKVFCIKWHKLSLVCLCLRKPDHGNRSFFPDFWQKFEKKFWCSFNNRMH